MFCEVDCPNHLVKSVFNSVQAGIWVMVRYRLSAGWKTCNLIANIIGVSRGVLGLNLLQLVSRLNRPAYLPGSSRLVVQKNKVSRILFRAHHYHSIQTVGILYPVNVLSCAYVERGSTSSIRGRVRTGRDRDTASGSATCLVRLAFPQSLNI
jgi:hypothetical protein